MKKIFSLLLLGAMTLSFCACESSAEKELRRAREAAQSANETYQHAVDSYNEAQRKIEAYQRASEKLNGMR